MATRLDDLALSRLRAALREPDLSGTKYRLAGVAGAGGMGTVYVVEDTELRRRVALKALDLPGPELEARLRREAQVLARLEHPGIVPVHEVGVLPDGRTYYTMKLVEGARLDRHLTAAVPLAERLRLFLRIADAVAFGHAKGVLHRDLKPENVMVGSFGEVLVMDWGLARIVAEGAEAAAARTTAESAVLGTPGFMSPEQRAGGSASVDARADVYSLGALLQWMAPAGAAPAALRAICRKAMAERPEDRYPDVPALAADVTRFADGAAVSAQPEGLLGRAMRLARRHRVALAIVVAYLAGRALILLFTGR
ncbi:MAG TPA: serine/threonine-protein kinase [Myxococcales bacterium]